MPAGRRRIAGRLQDPDTQEELSRFVDGGSCIVSALQIRPSRIAPPRSGSAAVGDAALREHADGAGLDVGPRRPVAAAAVRTADVEDLFGRQDVDRQRVDLYIRNRPSIVLVLFLIYLIVMVIGVMIPDLVARRDEGLRVGSVESLLRLENVELGGYTVVDAKLGQLD